MIDHPKRARAEGIRFREWRRDRIIVEVIYQKEIFLDNPYHLDEVNFLIRLYRLEYLIRRPEKRALNLENIAYVILKQTRKPLNLLSSLYGMYRLSNGIHRKLRSHLTIDGRPADFHIRDTNAQFCSIYLPQFRSCYEADVSGAVKIFLKEGGRYIDIGSNWGHHSFIAALCKNAHVVMFEPNPLVFRDIQNILSDLKISPNQVAAYNLALSEKESVMTLKQKQFESGTASIVPDTAGPPNNALLKFLYFIFRIRELSYQVSVRSLDSFNFKELDFIKIDAEGAELDILRGARATILASRPVIVYEFQPGDFERFDSHSRFFASLDYDVFSMKCAFLGHRSAGIANYLFSMETPEISPGRRYNLIAIPEERKLQGFG